MAGNIKGITVEIGGDTTKLSKALSEVNKETKSLQSELKGIDSLLKFDPSNTELLSQKQKVLAESIESTKSKLQTLKEVEEQVQKQFENGDIGEDEFRSFQREIEATEQKIEKLEAQMREFGSVSAQQIAAAGEEMKKIGSKIESAGKAIMPVSAAVAAVGTAAIKTTADFDSAMSQVKALSGATGDDFEKLRDKAIEMGAKTSFSASEAADGLQYMALAGWDTNEMIAGIQPVLNLAAAAQMDLGEASDIVTDALTAFGLTAEDTAEFVDVLAKTSSSSNTTVSQMGEAFKYVAPVAGALKYSVEDVGLALGTMANAGIKGSQAGTSLRTILTNLVSPSDKIAFAMERLGISITDNNGNVKSFRDVLINLRTSFADLTEAEQAQEAAIIGGQRGMSSLLAIVNSTDEEFALLADSIDNAGGSAQNMADTQLDNLSGQLTLLKSALESALISIGDALTPTIRELVAAIQSWVDKFNALPDSTKEVIAKIGVFVAALGPALIIIGKFIQAFGSVLTLAPKFVNMGESITVAISKISTIMSSASTAVTGALSAISAPVLAVVAVIAVLVAAFATLWNTNEEFRNKITEIWSGIKETLSGFFQGIVDRLNELGFNFESITDVIKAVWGAFCEYLAPIFEGAFSVISSVLSAVCDIILGILDVFIGIFTGDWEQAWTGITEIFSGIWNGITGVFSAVWDTITGIFNVFLGWFGTSWEEIWTGISTFFSDIWNGISSFLSDTWENIKTTTSGAADQVKSTVSSAWETVKSGTSSAWNTIKSNISSQWEEIKSVTSNAGEILKSGISTVWNYIKDSIIGTIMEGIKNIFQTQWNAAKTIIDTVSNAIKTVIENIWNVIKALLSGDMEQIKSTISSAWDNIKSAISNALSVISSTISDSFKSIWSTISGTMSNIRDNIINTLSSLPAKMQEIGSNIVSGIWNGISSGWQWLRDRVAGLAESLLNSAKAALGINSPSKEFADKVGQWIPAGIGEGIMDNAKAMLNPLDELLNGAVDGAAIEKNITAAYNAEVTATDNRRYDSVIKKLDALIDKTGNDIYLDGKTLIGGTKNRIDEVLANKTMLKARGM